MRDRETPLRGIVVTATAAPVLAGALWVLSRWNYLLYHSLVEVFSTVVAFSVFVFAWNTRHLIPNGYLLLLGIASLFVGALDLLHTLAYRGMGVFAGGGANLPTQLWIAARALQAGSLLAAPAFLARHLPPARATAVCALITVALAAAIFTGRFPDCYLEGEGLTRFKVASEYAIIAAVGGAALLLRRGRAAFDATVYRTLQLSLLATAAGEAAFTLYRDVYGVANFVGHLGKLLAFVLLHRALVETGLARPYRLLFRNLARSEDALRDENRTLAALKEELEHKNLALSEAVTQKNELLGIAAHDVRSPLTVIEMYGSLLRERLAGTGDGESLRFLEVIGRTVRKILALVSDLLDFTTIDSGRLRMRPEAVALRPLIEEHLEGHRALFRGKHVRVRLEAPGEVPPAWADPLRVEQVLANLLSNAVKFSPRNTAVTVRLFRQGRDAAVAVTDEGPGIPAEDLPRIFLPFSRARSRPTGGETSSGLGLAIVRKILDEHGGRITVESPPGEGATFTFFLPLAPAAAPAEEQAEAKSAAGRA